MSNADQFEAPSATFAKRSERWSWLAGSLLILIAWAFWLRLTRSDRALYSIGGVSETRVAAISLVQLVMLLVAGSAAALIAVRQVVDRLEPEAWPGLARLGFCAPVAATGAIISTLGRSSILDALKDR